MSSLSPTEHGDPPVLRSPDWSDSLFDGGSPDPTVPVIFTILGVFSPTEGLCDPPESPWGPLHVRRSSSPLAWSSVSRPSPLAPRRPVLRLPTPTRPAAPSTHSSRSRTPGPRSKAPASPASGPFHHGAEAEAPVVLSSCAWIPGGQTGAAPPPRPISFCLGVFLGFPSVSGLGVASVSTISLSSPPL